MQQVFSGASVSCPYQRRDLSNCGAGRLHVANNCGILSVKNKIFVQAMWLICDQIWESPVGSKLIFCQKRDLLGLVIACTRVMYRRFSFLFPFFFFPFLLLFCSPFTLFSCFLPPFPLFSLFHCFFFCCYFFFLTLQSFFLFTSLPRGAAIK